MLGAFSAKTQRHSGSGSKLPSAPQGRRGPPNELNFYHNVIKLRNFGYDISFISSVIKIKTKPWKILQ